MAGYSKNPLEKKLGIKTGFRILLVDQPTYYLTLFDELPEVEEVTTQSDGIYFIHLFCKRREALEKKMPELMQKLDKSGMLWVSWPKKSAKLETNIDGNIVRKLGLEIGLVDVKVCAVDEVWSGLKFMYRIKDR